MSDQGENVKLDLEYNHCECCNCNRPLSLVEVCAKYGHDWFEEGSSGTAAGIYYRCRRCGMWSSSIMGYRWLSDCTTSNNILYSC